MKNLQDTTPEPPPEPPESLPSPVVVTGGTGFLGLHTVQRLRDRGVDVIALDVEPFKPEDDVQGIEYVQADVRDHNAVRSALDEAEAVVHAAAALPLRAPEEIRSTAVDGTRTVLEKAFETGTDRVVTISTTAVYGTHDRHPITEDTPPEGVGPYGDAKVEAEALCRRFRDQGLTVPILRPKTFIGPQRLGVFQILFDWVESGASIPVVGPGTNRYQLLHVADLVSSVERMLAGDPADVDDVFNVGAAEFGTLRQDIQALLDHAGTDARVVGMPTGLTRGTLKTLNWLGLSPLYPWVYETAHEDSYVSIDKLRDLGWEPRYSNEEALIETYEWYRDHHGEAAGAPSEGADHRSAWSQGALRVAKTVMQHV